MLKLFDAVYHSALGFIIGDGFLIHRCIVYEKVIWPSLTMRGEQHCLLFIYKALCGKFPLYLSWLLSLSDTNDQTRSQAHIRLIIPRMISEAGKSAFTFYTPDK